LPTCRRRFVILLAIPTAADVDYSSSFGNSFLSLERMLVMSARVSLALLLALVVVSLALGDGGTDTTYTFAPPDDVRELQRGEWKLIAIQRNGIDLPKEELKQLDYCFTFKPDKVLLRYRGQNKEGTYKVDASKRLKEIDITIDNEKLQCVFELNKDKLTLALGKTERPKDFKPKRTDQIVFVMERVKP
jgi:uncharacterized protein (TIGR03067 family)